MEIDVMLGLLTYSTAENAAQWIHTFSTACWFSNLVQVWFRICSQNIWLICWRFFLFVCFLYSSCIYSSPWAQVIFINCRGSNGQMALWKFYWIYYRIDRYLINNWYFWKLLFSYSFRWWMWSQDGPPLQTASSFKRNCLQLLTIITVRNCKIKMTKIISNATHQGILFFKVLSPN